jgi:hypothetical protein
MLMPFVVNLHPAPVIYDMQNTYKKSSAPITGTERVGTGGLYSESIYLTPKVKVCVTVLPQFL